LVIGLFLLAVQFAGRLSAHAMCIPRSTRRREKIGKISGYSIRAGAETSQPRPAKPGSPASGWTSRAK
jgi:hypothetical protein